MLRTRTLRVAAGLAGALLITALGACARTGPNEQNNSGGLPSPVSTCPATVEALLDDNGKTVCVAPGGTLTVYLADGSVSQMWGPLKLTGNALAPTDPTHQFPAETTGGVFMATHRGTAVITSAHAACPPPAKGQVACMAIQAFSLTVNVG